MEKEKMKNILKIENLALLILGILLFAQTEYSWWWFLGLFFVPDISILGYLLNPKIGAICYNFVHNFIIGIAFYLLGVYFQNIECQVVGSVLFSHSAFDRILGFGLKYSDDFKNTHLGRIGEK